MKLKHVIKVWSQAGATLVASIVGFLVMRGTLSWSAEDVSAFMICYGSFMIVLRQMFSVTDSD